MVTNICSRGWFLCVDPLHSISICFCKFYPSIKLTFSSHIDSKKVCTLIKHSVTKWSGKCMMHGLMDMIPRTKKKTLSLRKIRVCYFFRAVNHSKNHVIPHPFNAATLNIIWNILQRWKTIITCPSNSPNTTENYQK